MKTQLLFFSAALLASNLSWASGPDFCPVSEDRFYANLDGSGGFVADAPIRFRDQERRSFVIKYHPGSVSGYEQLYSQYDLVTKEGFDAVLSTADNGLAILAPIDAGAPVDRNVFPLPTATTVVYECHVFEMQYSKATRTLVTQNERVRAYRAQDSETTTTKLVGVRKGTFGTKVRKTTSPFSVGQRADNSNRLTGKVWELLVIDDVITQAECNELVQVLQNNDPMSSFSLANSVRHRYSFGDGGGDSSDSLTGGQIRDRIGNLHLAAVGTSSTALVRE